MAPSLGCLNAVSLICGEEARGSDWDQLDEIESLNEHQQHLQEASLAAHDDSCLHDMFILDHLFEQDDEVIEHLMQKEASFMVHKEYAESYNSSDNAEWQESRQRAIYWMLTVQAYYRFNPCTVFLAVNYFDRFLANQEGISQKGNAPWLVQLIAVGCVSLAAKVEETKVPLLLDLQVGHVSHVFEARTIQRMELLILSTLKWRLSSVTPFSFLGFLIHKMKICAQSFSDLLLRVEELILNSCGELRLMAYSPSVLAIASVTCACDELLSSEAASCKHVLLSVWPNREGTIVECARLMQKLIVAADHPFWTSTRRLMISPNLPSAPESPNAVLDAPCFSCDSENTRCSLKSSKRQALYCSGPADGTNSLRSVMIAKAAAYSRSPSPSVCKTPDFCRKRKFNERYSTIGMRTAPRAEPAGGRIE